LRRTEYDRLVGSGTFEGERIELLEGVLVRMSPHGPLHDGTVERLTRILFRALDPRVFIRVQSAIAAGDGSEPEPDLALVEPVDHRQGHPTHAHLIVEVAESSLDRDREVKSRVYGSMGVPEYWIVNLVEGCIEVHTGPTSNGYGDVARVGRGSRIQLVQFPDIEIAVDDVLA
jgi:Uma2 family endonuclease